jgi:hypothetical protein
MNMDVFMTCLLIAVICVVVTGILNPNDNDPQP